MLRTVLIDDNAKLDPGAESRFTAWVETLEAPAGWHSIEADSLDGIIDALKRYTLECCNEGARLESISPDGTRAVVNFAWCEWYDRGTPIPEPLDYWTFNVVS